MALIFTAALGLLFPAAGPAAPLTGSLGVAAIPRDVSAAALREHVEILAADEMAGREVGTEGIGRAEEHIAAAFREYGLEPVPGQGGYYLGFSLYRMGFDPRRTALELVLPGGRLQAVAGRDFRPFEFSPLGEAEAEVVFAGYGITATEHGYDDYEGLDARGKIVLVLRHEPHEGDAQRRFDPSALSEHSLIAEKAADARRHEAAAMILVTDPLHHSPAEDLRLAPLLRLRPGARPERRQAASAALPAVQVSIPLARRLVAGSGRSLEELQRAVDRGERPAGLGLGGVRARLQIRLMERWQEVAARNVAGFLPGSDPGRRDEWILIGAHHDHLGAFHGPGDTIYNGADDNASGTAGVLELARVFAAMEERPARSLVFVTFSAEERGLLGSRALVEQRLIPVERLVLMLNMDMIGRNPREPVRVYGDASARFLAPVVREAGGELDLPLALHGGRIMSISDHTSFQQAGIPFLFLFTGLHRDYHQVTDLPERIDFGRMERVVRLAFETARRIAGQERAPTFLYHVGWLGLRFELAGDGPERRPVVVDVTGGSPAEEAGFREGDAILSVAGREPQDAAAANRLFAAVRPGARAGVELLRGERRLELGVQRAEPGYLGIALREAEEERPEDQQLEHGPAVHVSQVVGGGPAERAGLRPGDIIVELAGETVGVATLQDRLDQIGAGQAVEVGLLRQGRRVTLQVTLGDRPGGRPAGGGRR